MSGELESFHDRFDTKYKGRGTGKRRTFVWDDLSRDIELVIDCTENIR